MNHQTTVVLDFERGDLIQVRTEARTLTGVVYECEHREPELSCRGPLPGERLLYIVTPCLDRYRLQYTYYDELNHTRVKADRYLRTHDSEYVWRRITTDIQTITHPTGGGQP